MRKWTITLSLPEGEDTGWLGCIFEDDHRLTAHSKQGLTVKGPALRTLSDGEGWWLLTQLRRALEERLF